MTPQSDEDEVWRQIVASFNDTAERDPADQPWPDSENLPAEPARRVVREPEEALPRADDDAAELAKPTEPAEPAELTDGGQPDADEGHYVPPAPPPLPKADTATKIGWAALFGGPAFLGTTVLLGWEPEGWVLFAAAAAFIGGFVALVVRMGDGPPNDSGWDDGAVV
ncbi:hypothetical protein GCM10010156_12400 [Planobispora rosea]|uniref:Uncharacterized protein n=1 Tax=Planobispora rosea TaxID=35762 RepID=A0A8J3RTQ7_PLARO|nr:hypothetical protein [Planobispora rosea]GGS55117.1 hypothetical protein GCM10010156_12400 [Planobispora rosea]GIH82841.1 hypothetical protein Pro02_12490 [Planobispora rosea]